MSDRLVFQAVRLPLERFAVEISDGLAHFCDDRAIRSSTKADRLDFTDEEAGLLVALLTRLIANLDRIAGVDALPADSRTLTA